MSVIEAVPAQYADELDNRWKAYQGALLLGSTTLIATCRAVLNITFDKCSLVLGRPKIPRPAVVEQDGVLMLEYS